MVALANAILLSLFHLSFADLVIEQRAADADNGDSPFFTQRSTYIGRKLHTSIVAGGFLYTDGGEIYYTDGNDTKYHVAAAGSYSIDISSSWTNDTVTVNRIAKDIEGKTLNDVLLWNGLDNSSFYSYNGVKDWWYTPANPPANRLLEFTADGSGSGNWSEVDSFYTADSNFTNLVRVGGAASACGPDTCYAVGGYRDSRTDNAMSGFTPASGVVSYNFTSQIWHNDTMLGDIFTGAWAWGQVFFTDIAGDEGILVAIGGSSYSLTTGIGVPPSFDYIYLYDIATKLWHRQGATGDVPRLPRANYCTVGIRGADTVNQTFEIFMYGGSYTEGQAIDVDDVWVLSLPSFRWHQGGHAPVRGRSEHTCNIAGNRQMVIVGGLDPDNSASDEAVQQDIWPLGIAVYDLSDMMFKDRYDAQASAYTTPQVVQKWYADNGHLASDMDDDVKTLFVGSTTTDSGNGTSSGSANNSSGGGKSSNTGAIVGGVIGGLGALIAIVVAVWLIKRRQRRRRGQPLATTEFDYHEADGRPRFEVDGRQTHEKDANQRYELH